MRRLYSILVLLATVASVTAQSFFPPHPLTLWYTSPASDWQENSLPIGNGQFGASLFGGVTIDAIQFNEKTLWTGRMDDMQGGGSGYGRYMNFGWVCVEDADGNEASSDYVRWLDIENATAGVQYTLKNNPDTRFRRDYFSSQPAHAIVVKYSQEGSRKLHLRFTFHPGNNLGASVPLYTNGSASFGGKLDIVSFNAHFSVRAKGADVVTHADNIEVSGATEVLLVLAGATDFDADAPAFVSGTDRLAEDVAGRVDDALSKGYDSLLNEHTCDYSSFMRRCRLSLTESVPTIPTDRLIDLYSSPEATGTDSRFLEQLYFAFGRYLEICSSRGVGSPSNLQGIWCKESEEAVVWNSDIHSNINVQMNYWPAEPTNLSEMHMPFLDYIIGMSSRDNWKKVATRAGQSKGWSCYTENNIFGGMSLWGDNYLVANAWYCSHLWQHYRYTLDRNFLKRAFPVMWSAAEFWMERMIEDRVAKDGTLVCPDEYSPEQNDADTRYIIEDATAHSQQLMVELFSSVQQSIEILGREVCGLSAQQVTDLDRFISRLDRGLHKECFTAGDWEDWGRKWGIYPGDELLREWKYSPYTTSVDKAHRHLSHLMALYPFSQITPESEYFQAAVNSLRLRGDEATGWSMGWKINLWARAQDGNYAHGILRNALRHCNGNSGVYYNLYDAHPPFQIDGNFGVCAGIAEMLLQSTNGIIRVLPALPDAWLNGSVRGLKAEGDFTVDIDWYNGKATSIRITANQGGLLKLKYNGHYIERKTTPREVVDII